MLLKHVGYYLLGRGLPGIINLFAITIYTRLLSPAEYGQYAIVIAGVGLTHVILYQWLSMGLLRFIASYKEKPEVFLSTILAGFSIPFLISLVVTLVGLLVISDSSLQKLILLGLLLLWVQAFFDLNLDLARSQFSPKRYGVLFFINSSLSLAIGGGLALLQLGAVGLLLGVILSMALPMFWSVRRHWQQVSFRLVDVDLLKSLFRYGLPFSANFALTFVVSSSDRFLLGWMLGADAAGVYSVGYDLAQRTVGLLMAMVSLAGYPLIIRELEEKGVEAAQHQLKLNSLLLLGVGIPAATGIILLSHGISTVFLGSEFRNSAAILMPWVALAILFSGMKSRYTDLAFQLGKYTMGQVWVVLIAAIINFVLNLILIPFMGLLGAAYATVAAYAIGFGLSWHVGRRVFPIPALPTESLKIVLATMGMCVVLWPTLNWTLNSVHLAVQVVLGATAYGALLLLMDLQGARNRLWQFYNGKIARNIG